jgi:hypothetical protein
MATRTDNFGNPVIFAGSGDAATVFGQNQQAFNANAQNYAGAPRPRYLFMVRFVRASGSGSPTWADGMSFAVRTFDRPKITPQIQELNQYNKKRLVQTGVKYSPCKISFYDTIDAAVQQMWYEYTNFYFGDFRQSTGQAWSYDVTAAQFQGTENGFGFSPNLGFDSVSDLSKTAYFFDRIECYQFYAGEYMQFDLINPKISSFDPDAFESEHSDFHGIDMTVEYEAIQYQNQNLPASISSNAFLSSWMKKLNPAYDPFVVPNYIPGDGAPGDYAKSTGLASSTNLGSSLLGLAATFLAPGGTGQLGNAAKTIGSGILGSFGTAVFGQNNPLSGAVAGAIPGIMNGSFSGASFSNQLINGISRNPSAALASLSTIGQNQIPASTYGQSLGVLGKFVSSNAPTSTLQGIAAAATSAALSGKTPVSNVASGTTSSGLAPSNAMLGAINAASPVGAQVGVLSTPTGGFDDPSNYG